jgi:tRNA threonylcarbamoyladenosine biosynthesis protein TsaE
MTEHTITIKNLEEYGAAAQEFIPFLEKGRVFAFYGKMGSGKTTFIKSLCQELGVEDAINSPTFAIVNEYEDKHGETIYHFDFYRIKSIEEVYNMGYEEYVYSNAYCFMEWPELIEELLPEDHIRVDINEEPDGTRTIKITTD